MPGHFGTRRAREPLRWTVAGAKQKNGRLVGRCRRLLGLRFADDTAAYFLLELDRGHMPNVRVRGKLEQTSIGRKLGIYYEGWRTGRQVEQFGLKQLRVLIVTSSMARVANMIAVVRQLTGGTGSNFFLFVDQERLAAGNPLDASLVSGRGEAVRLVD